MSEIGETSQTGEMSDVALQPPSDPTSEHALLSAAERAMLSDVETQRRLHLLRLILVPLLALTILALPFAVQTAIDSAETRSIIQIGVGLVAFALGVWALHRRWVNMAALCLFTGVAGVIILLLINDGVFVGPLDLRAIPAFGLLVLPVTIAGVFGTPRTAFLATLAAAGFTCAGILLTPHAPNLRTEMALGDGLVVFTVPVATQLALGILIVAATRSYQRTQRELVRVRLAYAREKELERLKDQFISSVNHELRTPIMALQGYIELARELNARGDLERQEKMLARGAEAVEHLAGMVKSALNVRRVEADANSMRPVACALQPLVVSATHLLDPRETGMRERPLRLHVPENLTVYADPDRLRQVLLNLLSNACKYSPPGSPLEVTAYITVPEPSSRRWGRHAIAPAPRARVAVRDYGQGIPPDQADLLFQRFVRLERDIASNVTGTGLGLAICRAY
ncbi:MAG TPA: ATP-binding protein, partial [Ktedonobacterales bacterium]|nr:ATP-binding protein [Ktedonobacterales bacterium]